MRKFIDFWNFCLVAVPHRVSYLSLISSPVELLLRWILSVLCSLIEFSSTSDLLSVQQQIPGDGSIASPAENFEKDVLLASQRSDWFFLRNRDVPSVVRSECLIDVLLFGGCSP